MFSNLDEHSLINHSIQKNECIITSDGVISVLTGECTGRSPNAKHIVKDTITEGWVDWSVNQSMTPEDFGVYHRKIMKYFDDLTHYYTQSVYASHDTKTRLSLKVNTTTAWQSLFTRNMFIIPKKYDEQHEHDWNIFCAPKYSDTPTVLISFTQKVIIITGTHYAGEVKKSVFTVLNFLLPLRGILPMHCAVNTNRADSSPAVFFGLSGTGKTTLSSDMSRILIGDDEHCWTDSGTYNFEGGCYAKVIGLSSREEPQIWSACHTKGAILENVVLDKNRRPDFDNDLYTANSRASYPITHIANADPIGFSGHPKNVVMLTCDAFGVLPPVSLLSHHDAIQHFLMGYTAKVAGTESGITEPIETFSHCYGAPFMPHRPTVYSNLLLEKIKKHNVDCWLVNTGWSGGPYGTGKRLSIDITRKIINAIHDGSLKKESFIKHKHTGLRIPERVNKEYLEVLHPERTWESYQDYQKSATQLMKKFKQQSKKMNII